MTMAAWETEAMLREIEVSVRTRLPTATAARKIELSDQFLHARFIRI